MATDTDHLTQMVADLTDRIYKAQLCWKESSLEVLCGGMASNSQPTIHAPTPSGKLLYKVVLEMEVLGSKLDVKGSTNMSLHHRLRKAEGKFWGHARIFTGPGSIASKFKAWAQGPGH